MTTRIAVFGLVTSNLSASLDFYRALGVPVPETADDAPHVEAELPGGLRLAWDTQETMRSFAPEWQPGHGGGFGVAFACDSPAEVDRVYAELTAAGHPGELPPWDAVWGQRYATVLDPDGNSVDLFAPLPGAADA
ncbi:VOC family protein [Streptomyces bohaiensis]|uniref:Glyoxalase n=1 Tax=Streptomyces bohaiensis TaxID=1431344 RepID=A0ABX1C826_9ACTN|nr:VOC family protein [Streptomyces bohaiensis]NJQ15302.1 glyoxalase [Streptomyces bohaiensis]